MGESKLGFSPDTYRRKVGEAVFAAIPPIEGTAGIEPAIVAEALLEIVGLLMAADPRVVDFQRAAQNCVEVVAEAAEDARSKGQTPNQGAEEVRVGPDFDQNYCDATLGAVIRAVNDLGPIKHCEAAIGLLVVAGELVAHEANNVPAEARRHAREHAKIFVDAAEQAARCEAIPATSLQ
jgi:hypothetical protein